MEIPSKYNPGTVEDKWYSFWMENEFFKSQKDEREPYTIVIPPPNVTGVLHMGHMLNNTIQDILVRRARMTGKNACWVPGTDHASIATEAKVVGKLKSEGVEKKDLTRDEFLKHAWKWTDKHGGIILEQLKKLGASCDWDRTAFTMDEERSTAVIKSFVELFNKGYIYRGVRMVNWDPAAKTAVSDEEVIYKEEKSKLYFLRYKVEGSANEWVTIATTRPETILGDTAVCVNPNDERYSSLKGKRVLVPLIERSIPIIEDDYVDMEFGTGCLKITPAHDINDYEIGMRFNLESIDIFNDDGTLNEKAELFIGKDRFDVKKLIVPELEKAGNLVKIEDYTNKVGYSERTDVVIEPKLSAQWFLKMEDLAKPALENVLSDNIKFHPPKYKNLYKHWMENIKDWCVSRQLWWGHRIPVYYLDDGSYVVAETIEKALKLAIEKTGNSGLTVANLKQDEDVLDTWASSWLWPFSVFSEEDQEYYYPTSDLVTAPDIIFFWVARMIMAGYAFKGEKPFSNVYYTGMVRDKLRRKMSKSLGNSPDPLDLIAKYGADGVRVGMLLCSPAGNDILFDEALTEQGRNFCNKLWNAFRLVNGWDVSETAEQPEAAKAAIHWFDNELSHTINVLEGQFKKYRISEALMTVYTLVRDEFSGWYLEAIKPEYQKPIDKLTYKTTIEFFDKVVRILHPFMPFISEEIYQYITKRAEDESIMNAQMPKAKAVDNKIIQEFEEAKKVITFVRNTRIEKQIGPKEKLILWTKNDKNEGFFDNIIIKLGNLEEKIERNIEEIPGQVATSITPDAEYYIPLGNFINADKEIESLQKDIEYTKGFIASINKKLLNEKFVNNAPKNVVELERKKLSDAEAKLDALETQLKIFKF
ncbi:MAG: valine--tRNA ligase [Bacteroidales bacterium]|nr:valine--tRNA ligase [Bacteroidales bacterium]MBN2817471.1 valine--tRNA ligase [Bacteroidales bacterium]